MQVSARTCGRSAADKCKALYFNHPSQGNSTNCYFILGPRDTAAPPTSQQIGQFPPKRVKYHPFFLFFFFLPHPQDSSLCSQPVRGNVRRTGRMFPEHAERSFLDPEYSFVAVRRIPRTRFAKQKVLPIKNRLCWPRFDEEPELCSRSKRSAQLRTEYVGLGSTNNPNYVHEANVCPIKNRPFWPRFDE